MNQNLFSYNFFKEPSISKILEQKLISLTSCSSYFIFTSLLGVNKGVCHVAFSDMHLKRELIWLMSLKSTKFILLFVYFSSSFLLCLALLATCNQKCHSHHSSERYLISEWSIKNRTSMLKGNFRAWWNQKWWLDV